MFARKEVWDQVGVWVLFGSHCNWWLVLLRDLMPFNRSILWSIHGSIGCVYLPFVILMGIVGGSFGDCW